MFVFMHIGNNLKISMDTFRPCKTFPESKCLSADFCDKFHCTRHGALNQSFESNPIGAAFVSEDGMFLVVNQSYADMLGYTIPEMKKLTYQEMTFPDDLDKDELQAMDIMAGKIKSYDIEKRYIKKDGSTTWVNLFVNGVFDPKTNDFMYFVVHAIDIDYLKQQKDIIHFATEAGDIGVWVWEETTDNLTWNDKMYDIFEVDYNKKDLGYNDWREFVHEEDVDKAEIEIKDSMRNGVKFNTRFRIRVNGKIKHLKAIAAKTGVSPNRKLTGCNIDITDIVKTQELLEKSNDDLEKFAYLTSHDLKAPIRSIQQYISLISSKYKEKFDDNGRELLEIVENNAKEMQNMISAMLALCKYSTSGTSFERVNLKSAWEEALNRFNINFKKENININVNLDKYIFGDRMQVSSVFQNLLSNSLKYRQKRRKLNINISVKEKDGKYIVSFKDNGKGISKEKQKFLFKPYVKNVKINANQSRQGNGLGLYICNKIMDNHQGSICVFSEVNKGSTFYLEFKKGNENA